jgi:hypothetical protein
MTSADEMMKSQSPYRRHPEMTQSSSLALTIPAFLMLLAPGFAIARSDELAQPEVVADAEPGEEVLITLEAPLTSPLFSETPVAVVDEEPITLDDLVRRIGSIHQEVEEGSASTGIDYAELLDRVITTKLIVHEARNIGLDELPDVVKNIETVSTELLTSKLMSRQIDDIESDPSEVAKLYELMSREFLLSTVRFQNEADALSFKEQVDSGADFEAVAKQFGEEGRAEFDAGDEEFAKLKELLPRIAQAVIEMKEGSVSEIFADPGVFIIFHVEAIRPYDDPALREEARQKALEPAKQKAAREYAEYLKKKHSTVDERLLKKVDFEVKKTGFLGLGKEEPVDFDELEKDDRVVATVNTDPPFVVTIADLANAIQEAFFHGVETAAGRKKSLNQEKQIMLENMLFKQTAVAEARSLGLDQTGAYLDTMDEFTSSLLFDVFVKKVIVPDVKISEDEVREYYEAHIDEFSTPKMLGMDAIIFAELRDAEAALGKLQKQADFNWVSANSPGRVAEVNSQVFDFDGALLTVTALPEGLHEAVEDAERGDAVIYSDEQGYHHVIVIDQVFPAMPRPYDSVRDPVVQKIFGQKIKLLIDDWSAKLKEAYETRIFVKGLED